MSRVAHGPGAHGARRRGRWEGIDVRPTRPHRPHAPHGTASRAHRPLDRERPSLDGLIDAIRAGWGDDTSWIDDWHPRNPPRGQCGTSSLVVQDHRGGTLLQGVVEGTPGVLTVHYWNVTDVGQLDLTWHQFPEGARIVEAAPVDRADLLANRWFVDRYVTLRDRVAAAR